MAEQPTINDYFNLIRGPLDDALTKLRRDIKGIENQLAAGGQTGAAIRKVLDVGRESFTANAVRTFREIKRGQSKTSFSRSQLLQVTMQERTNFSLATKSAIEPIKRRARGATGAIKLVDHELEALDRSLQMKARQMNTGLLDLEADVAESFEPQTTDRDPSAGAFAAGAFASSAFSTTERDTALPELRVGAPIGKCC